MLHLFGKDSQFQRDVHLKTYILCLFLNKSWKFTLYSLDVNVVLVWPYWLKKKKNCLTLLVILWRSIFHFCCYLNCDDLQIFLNLEWRGKWFRKLHENGRENMRNCFLLCACRAQGRHWVHWLLQICKARSIYYSWGRSAQKRPFQYHWKVDKNIYPWFIQPRIYFACARDSITLVETLSELAREMSD